MIEFIQIIGSFTGVIIGFLGAIIGAVLAVLGTYLVTKHSMNKQIAKMEEQIQFDKDNASLGFLSEIEITFKRQSIMGSPSCIVIKVNLENKGQHQVSNLCFYTEGSPKCNLITPIFHEKEQYNKIELLFRKEEKDKIWEQDKFYPILYVFSLSKDGKIIIINVLEITTSIFYMRDDCVHQVSTIYVRSDKKRFGEFIYKINWDIDAEKIKKLIENYRQYI